jgi:hypothetical protein
MTSNRPLSLLQSLIFAVLIGFFFTCQGLMATKGVGL